MRPEEFSYELPPELIAQYPLERRDSSRLMVLNRVEGSVEHGSFLDIKGYLERGDLLVLNDTKVIPARLMGRKPTGGKAEVFLVRKKQGVKGEELWDCLVRPSKGLNSGTEIAINGGPSDIKEIKLSARLVERGQEGIWTCSLSSEGDVTEAIEAVGRMPLPPYIKREAGELDKKRYQTIFAKNPGAVAAPTAGLHFTPELIEGLKGRGVEVHYITLHTGPATFMPVRSNDITGHTVPRERFRVDPGVFEAVTRAIQEGKRVIAVGSTVTRALETAFAEGFNGDEGGGSGKNETGLFICPGFEFKVVGGLLTNFHLPRSSLIMLVSAFAGREKILGAYREAVKKRYRFYSYGDAMLIL
jgi:S-adenosylmethionine:tRNA ribosyltransferase-isomerase